MEKCFTIEEDHIYDEDYQMKMLRFNEIKGILNVKAMGVNEKTRYSYDITGKISLVDMFARNKIEEDDLRKILRSVQEVYDEIKRHLLRTDKLIYNPEYIFCENNQYYFCYYPGEFGGLGKEFQYLCKFIVDKIDYNNDLVMERAFGLFEKSEEKNFDMQVAIHQVLSQGPGDSDDEYHIEKVELEEIMLKEEPTLAMDKKTGKFRKLPSLFKKKKNWNEFEGLILEMEE